MEFYIYIPLKKYEQIVEKLDNHIDCGDRIDKKDSLIYWIRFLIV